MSLEIVDHKGLMLLVAASAVHSKSTSASTTQAQAAESIGSKRAQQEETASRPGSSKKAKSSPLGIQEPNTQPPVKPLVCAHGSHIYKVRNYHDKIMTLAQKLSEVGQVTLQMEQNGGCIDENILFATVIEKCGNELSDVGEFLLKTSHDIKAAHKASMAAEAKKSTSKKTHSYCS